MSDVRTGKKPVRRRMRFVAVLLVPIVFAALGYAGWHFARDSLSRQPEYRLSAERVEVSPPPDWVPDDFVRRVLQSAGLESTASILDPNLPSKLAQAFAADPWVEGVLRVEVRFPSGADVRLTYRRPVALVEVASQGLFPVDRNGVLLPTDYFIDAAPEKKNDYPRIEGIRSTPFGTVGTPWGDPLVHDAAGLAGLVDDLVDVLDIAAVVPSSVPSPGGGRIVCRLRTHEGTEVVWGRFAQDDPKAEVKKQRLRELADLYDSLDGVPNHFRPIDLSNE